MRCPWSVSSRIVRALSAPRRSVPVGKRDVSSYLADYLSHDYIVFLRRRAHVEYLATCNENFAAFVMFLRARVYYARADALEERVERISEESPGEAMFTSV